MGRRAASWLLAPYHAVALATGAKSFLDNPLIGNERLNRWGLHVARMRAAERMAASRRQRLAHLLGASDSRDFARDGYLIRENFLPPSLFNAIRDEAHTLVAPARDMMQGDAVTRRIALDATVLSRCRAMRALLEDREWLGLIRYVGSSSLEPLVYLQTIFSRVCEAPVDPQTLLHADTFHSTVKAWYFVSDVDDDDGPFVYVPGSHRLTSRRLAWERRASITAASSGIYQAARGSPRIGEEDLGRLGLGCPKSFGVPGNTLIVADTMGFHARGRSTRPSTRTEIWAYGRRNPFLPWTGLDLRAAPFLRGRVVPLAWKVLDIKERIGLGRSPWRSAGIIESSAPPDLSLFGC